LSDQVLGSNVTGVTSQAVDLSAKRLEVLKKVLPRLQRVAVLWEPEAPASRDSMRETEAAARALGIDIEGFGVNRADDLAGAFQYIAAGGFNALDVLASPIVTGSRARILAFCRDARMPGLFQERPFVAAGGLLSYGPNFERLFHRMAYHELDGLLPARDSAPPWGIRWMQVGHQWEEIHEKKS
jgi:putative tryptophan/tyrosine transport system substrate-binding protein